MSQEVLQRAGFAVRIAKRRIIVLIPHADDSVDAQPFRLPFPIEAATVPSRF